MTELGRSHRVVGPAVFGGPIRFEELNRSAQVEICDCPCHEVIQPGLIPCPACGYGEGFGL